MFQFQLSTCPQHPHKQKTPFTTRAPLHGTRLELEHFPTPLSQKKTPWTTSSMRGTVCWAYQLGVERMPKRECFRPQYEYKQKVTYSMVQLG